MAGVRYVPDDRSFAAFMKSAAVAKVVESVALKAKSHAESISPVATGKYRGSFDVDTRVIGDRVMSVLYNTAPHAVVVEVHLGHRVLGRTVDYIESIEP